MISFGSNTHAQISPLHPPLACLPPVHIDLVPLLPGGLGRTTIVSVAAGAYTTFLLASSGRVYAVGEDGDWGGCGGGGARREETGGGGIEANQVRKAAICHLMDGWCVVCVCVFLKVMCE